MNRYETILRPQQEFKTLPNGNAAPVDAKVIKAGIITNDGSMDYLVRNEPVPQRTQTVVVFDGNKMKGY